MSTYRQFIFSLYDFDVADKTLSLQYSFDDVLHFTETYRFDFPFVEYNPAALDRAAQLLFFMAGVSYYKAFRVNELVVRQGEIDQVTAEFLQKTWQRGLGEYWYVNNLDPRTEITFPVNSAGLQPVESHGKGPIVGLGGGKDSLVSVELMRNHTPGLATWSMNHRPQLTPLVERIGLPHYWVERSFDTSLLAHKDSTGYLNGHIPISAIFACVGTIVTILSGKRDYVLSNEQSANEPTLTYRGVAINHQYSKSQEFEADYQAVLQHNFGHTTRYYSLLRPFSELRIAEMFAQTGFAIYKDVFSSCNRAYTLDSNVMSWCGQCAKCAFVCLVLAPFVDRAELAQLWHGNVPLLDPDLKPTYDQLLGIASDKPLDCVGEVQESRAAMRLAEEKYPELRGVYSFDLPESYDFRTEYSHCIPADITDSVFKPN